MDFQFPNQYSRSQGDKSNQAQQLVLSTIPNSLQPIDMEEREDTTIQNDGDVPITIQ